MLPKRGLTSSISPNKFERLKNKDVAIKGRCHYTPVNSYESVVSLEAFTICDEFIYMKIPVKKQPENRLKTVCLRLGIYAGYHNMLPLFVEDETLL
jgi:hypothetical protein